MRQLSRDFDRHYCTTQAEAEWSDAYGGGTRGNFQYSAEV